MHKMPPDNAKRGLKQDMHCPADVHDADAHLNTPMHCLIKQVNADHTLPNQACPDPAQDASKADMHSRATATAKGRAFEAQAAHYLQGLGMEIVATNYYAKVGEVDLIALDRTALGAVLVFVEVKGRADGRFGSPLLAITPAKIRKLKAASAHFLQAHPSYDRYFCRFDVIAITGTLDMVHIKGAFE